MKLITLALFVLSFSAFQANTFASIDEHQGLENERTGDSLCPYTDGETKGKFDMAAKIDELSPSQDYIETESTTGSDA